MTADGDLPDLETEQALDVLLEQARIRLEMPRLLAQVLASDPALAQRAIREWADRSRPLAEVAEELRRAAGEA